jgi:hypothetical protein
MKIKYTIVDIGIEYKKYFLTFPKESTNISNIEYPEK